MTVNGTTFSVHKMPGGLRIAGEIDAATSPAVASALAGRQPGHVRVDLADVSFIDSSGLRVLVEAALELAETGHRLIIQNPSVVVRRLVELSGLLDLFVHDT